MSPELRRRRGLALALALACALACASDEEKLEGHLERAARAHAAGEVAVERIELQAALSLAPDDARVNFRLAEWMEADGRIRDAVFYYSEAYRLDPTRIEAGLRQLGVLLAGDPDEAERLLEDLQERAPDHARVQARKAELRLLRRGPEAALPEARRAVSLDPGDPLAQRILGTVHRARVAEALRRAEAVDDEIRAAAAAAFEAAERAGAERGEPGRWFDRKERARVHAGWPGHEEEAARGFREAYALARQEGHLEGRQRVLREASRFAARLPDPDLAGWVLEEQTELAPERPVHWSRLARLHARSGGRRSEIWERAVRRNPETPLFRVRLARTLRSESGLDAGLASLAEAEEALGPHPELLLAGVGLLLDAGRLDQAAAAVARLGTVDPDGPAHALAQATLALARHDEEEALRILRPLADSAQRMDVLSVLARAEARTGRPHAALAATERALDLGDDPSPRLLRSHLARLAATGDWQGVIAAYRELRRRGVGAGVAEEALRAEALYETGRPEAGRKVLDALAAHPGAAIPVARLAARHESGRDPDFVEQALRRALAQDPDRVDLLEARVSLAFARGRPDEALALSALPADAPARGDRRLVRARALERAGRREEALAEALRAGRDPDPAPAAATLAARLLASLGRPGEAVRVLEAKGERAELGGAEEWQLARLYTALGRDDDAGPALERALAKAPDLVGAKNDLAWWLAERGEALDRALTLAREAREAAPASPAIADTLGFVYLRKGLLGPAAAELEAAIEMAGEGASAGFHVRLGRIRLAQGRRAEGLRELETALALDPDHREARRARAEALARDPDAG